MNEDFAPFELAVKLKEKGFNIPFYFYYRTDDKFLRHANVTNPLVYCDKIDDEVVIAPTISQVLKWLREEKKIHIAVDIMKAYPAGVIIKWGYNVVLIDKYEVYHHDWNSDSYEQATLAGIEYVLDNLI